MVKSFFQKTLNTIYEKFHADTAKMLIYTGTIGWGLSSLAQIGAILINPKIKTEQKSFLLPQEAADAMVNIGSFFFITLCAKKLVAKMATTGKLAPKDVREYINRNKELFKDSGKFDFNLDKVMESDKFFPKESYLAHKNVATTLGTVGASILASNIVTPVLRNTFASKVQKKYLNNPSPNYSSDMKV